MNVVPKIADIRPVRPEWTQSSNAILISNGFRLGVQLVDLMDNDNDGCPSKVETFVAQNRVDDYSAMTKVRLSRHPMRLRGKNMDRHITELL